MNSVKKSIIFAILSVVLLVSVSQSATLLPVIDISGGETHTLVLGQNGQAFACGERSRTVEGILRLSPPSATTATTLASNLFISKISACAPIPSSAHSPIYSSTHSRIQPFAQAGAKRKS